MKITAESELMVNHKYADVIAPDAAFDVLQTPDGDTLFFSIGTDDTFYVTRQLRNSQTGWTRTDLSSSIRAVHDGTNVIAKSFALSQNSATLKFDAALVCSVSGSDTLYLSLGHSSSPEDWGQGVVWSPIPFDAANIAPPSVLNISDVYLMNFSSSDGNSIQSYFVDILRDPTNTTVRLLDRYYILPAATTTPKWVLHSSADLEAGSITSCAGIRPRDGTIPGIYTFGEITGEWELNYTPEHNKFDKKTPISSRLTLPDRPITIASAENVAGFTNLFLIAADGLYLYTPDNQSDGAEALHVIKDTITYAGVSSITTSADQNRTVVWCNNPLGDLFYLSCPAGSEADASSWSTSVPIMSNIFRFAFYLNAQTSNNMLFVHNAQHELVHLTQDPQTSIWAHRSLLLPPAKPDSIFEYDSFTTHIQILDDNGVLAGNQSVTLTPTAPVTVYINDVYHSLALQDSVSTTTDATGTITIIQETQTLSAVCFTVAFPGSDLPLIMDPCSNAMAKLSSSNLRNDMDQSFPRQDKTVTPLVPSSVSADTKDTIAKSLSNLAGIRQKLPADGSVQPSGLVSQNIFAGLEPQLPQSWAVTKSLTGFQYHEGEEAKKHLHHHTRALRKSNSASITESGFTYFESKIGDLLRYLAQKAQQAVSWGTDQVNNIWKFTVTLGNEVYSAVLDCATAIAGAAQFVWGEIEVAWADIKAYLGFLFDWDDILRTHKVIKNVIKQTARKMASSIDPVRKSINHTFNDIETSINNWAGLSDPGQTIGTKQQAGSSAQGSSSPQSNWAMSHTKNGVSSSTTTYDESGSDSAALTKIIQSLQTLCEIEEDDLKDAITQVKTQIVDQFASLTPVEVIKRVIGIVADFVLKSAQDLITPILDIAEIIIDGLLDALEAPLQIPVLSKFYTVITKGETLSVLDVICLVGAVPATIIHKLMTSTSPYPDNSAINALINAPDFDTLQVLLRKTSLTTAAPKHQAHHSSHCLPDTMPKELLGENDGMKTFNIVMSVCGMYGAIIVVFTNTLKMLVPVTPVGLPMRLASMNGNFLYLAPSIVGFLQTVPVDKSTEDWGNDVLLAICFFKVIADNAPWLSGFPLWVDYISPYTESVLNMVWLFPPIMTIVQTTDRKESDWLNLAANLSFDLSGYLAFFQSSEVVSPAVAKVVFAVAQVLTLGYGALNIGYVVEINKGN